MRRALFVVLLAGCSPKLGELCAIDADCKGISGDAWCSKVSVCTMACGTQPDGGLAPSCPSGYVCVDSPVRSVCLAPCTSDAQCRKGWTCNVGQGGAKACQYTDFLTEPAAPR